MLLWETMKLIEDVYRRSLAEQPAELEDDVAISNCEEVSGITLDDGFVYGDKINNPYIFPELCCL